MSLPIVLAALIAAPAAAPPAAPEPVMQTVPERFLGTFNGLLEDCRLDANTTEIVIAPDRITTWEGQGAYIAINYYASGRLVLTADIAAPANGAPPGPRTFTFSLKSQDLELAEEGQGEVFTRWRCSD